MAIAAPRQRTIEELAEDLGGISTSRIRLDPRPGTANEQDVIEIEAHEDRLFELIDGTLVEKGMGLYESVIATIIARLLGDFVEEHNLGFVAGEGGMMKILPGQVR